MGLCNPKLIPSVPSLRRPDPVAKEKLDVGISVLNYLETYDHFGVWFDGKKIPTYSFDQKKSNLWLWLRRSRISRPDSSDNIETCMRVDLENFDRAEKNGVGRVLYSAVFPTKRVDAQITEQIALGHREELAADERFSKYFGKRHDTPRDQTPTDEDPYFCRNLDTSFLTKFTVSFRVDFHDGNLCREEALFSEGKPLFLDITLKGAVATSYFEHGSSDQEANLRKVDTKYFDAHYRLFSGEKAIAEWNIERGDLNMFSSFEVDCSYFTSRFFWPQHARIVTKPESGMDSALALLIAHVVSVEMSVVNVDSYFRVETPSCPPLKAESSMDGHC